MTTPTVGTWNGRWIAVWAVLVPVLAGCVIQEGGIRKPDTAAPSASEASQKKIDDLTVSLQAAKKDLEAAREEKKRSQDTCEAKMREMEVRLQAMEAAYANALNEVLRLRTRIGSLAAEPEAAAMFAEARVIVDRMEEEAFNDAARGYLHMSQKYLKDGKKSMEERNYGKAALLFEMITATYQDFKKCSPRKLAVISGTVVLRASPNASAEKAGVVEQGGTMEGVEKREGWFRVKTATGLAGWIKRELVY